MTFGPVVMAQELRGRSDLVWLDARPGPAGRAAYDELHVAGAAHADLDRDLSGDASRPEDGGRHPLPALGAFAATLGRWGIRPETPVVIYDDQGGANAAARAWWMLRAVCHADVAILDGGFAAAVRAGIATSTLPGDHPDVGPYPVPERWALPLVSRDEVMRRREDPDWVVLDVRSAERYSGHVEPFDPIAGHIPGAVNVPLTENLDPSGSFRSAAELAQRYERLLGGRSPAELIVHCGSGVTACHTLAALERAGLGGASLYVGSWSEWCRSDLPMALAPAPGSTLSITVNGEPQEIEPGTTVRALVERLGLGQGPVAVERNAEVVPRASHATTVLEAGDALEIVHFVGGG